MRAQYTECGPVWWGEFEVRESSRVRIYQPGAPRARFTWSHLYSAPQGVVLASMHLGEEKAFLGCEAAQEACGLLQTNLVESLFRHCLKIRKHRPTALTAGA